MSQAGNMYGKCRDSEVWLTREADKNAFGDAFKQMMNVVPVVGSLVAGFVPDTLTNNALRQCPGAVTDYTTPYSQTYALIGVVVALLVVYMLIPKS